MIRLIALALLLIVGCTTVPIRPVDQPPTPRPEPSAVPTLTPAPNILMPRMFGFTVDDPWQTEIILKALKSLPGKPGMRVVFDEGIKAREYAEIVKLYRPHAFIVGELLDSFFVKDCNLSCYENRTKDYLQLDVDVLEIMNEGNGDWLGAGVIQKLTTATKLAKAAGKTIALTLYMDEHETWEAWARDLSPDLRASFDYVLMSHYADDNSGHEPDWQKTINLMGDMFPKAKLGIGEMGPGSSRFKRYSVDQRMKLATHYWTLPIKHPRWIGFGGYWYGSQELKKHPAEFVNALKAVMR